MKISGKEGEEIAEHFLVEKGYQILMRNFKVKKQEIDLITQQGSTIVFVEVKSRSNTDFGFPEHFLSPQQEGRIRNAATHYLAKHNITTQHIRFDIISIIKTGEKIEVEHFEDAF
jgi:putative endonuclease